ncbi:hypothetical protein SLEP1_g2533 [Rubroshorea leprosula]|uniref:RING-type E3 ubiquitin transferase n=1 Tax=Rubroshorea leprosula TaxID=152421 RepID=A0AAV5HQS7_9ROSI|nr:hypothetical protein SLEP1_g2533 [Rubroshorea leprosula]
MHPSNSLTPISPSSDAVDTSPLLNPSLADHLLRSRRLLRRSPPQLRGAAARLLRRASSRRMMLRESSILVRETAAEQLEERQSDWAYSKPIIVLDVLWNLMFILLAVVVLGLSMKENPCAPLRVWVIGYVFQCLIHVGCIITEYRRRRQGRVLGLESGADSISSSVSVPGTGNDPEDSEDFSTEHFHSENETNIVKCLESTNTMFSFIWWIIGFYWVTEDSRALTHDSPLLYWLCVAFLAFDVVFVVICVAAACLIGIAVCCCLPCIIAILYALTDREGATEEEIHRLPKYKFKSMGDSEKVHGEIQESHGGIMTECNADSPERVLSREDAECCVCLSAYEDGTELRELPCHHHFHCTCIDKWLFINATCPLCKFNILKAGNQSCSEEV